VSPNTAKKKKIIIMAIVLDPPITLRKKEIRLESEWIGPSLMLVIHCYIILNNPIQLL
jgi:hypothetical protein